MFPKHLKRHGHGHGHGHHKKMHHHGGKHEKFGHHFKHPGGHHMGPGRKHFHGLHFQRGCFSEGELPNNTTQNLEAGTQDARESNLCREFHHRRHHWRFESCHCEQTILPADNVQNDKEGNEMAVVIENTEGGENAAVTSTQEGQDKAQVYHCKVRHYFRHHGFKGTCPRCTQNTGDTTENEATTEGEKEENQCIWKHSGFRKGKRGHGFRKPCRHCQGESTTETEGGSTEDEGAVKHGYIRKHQRGRHGGRGPKHGKDCPKCFELGARIFEERHRHGGKWDHGPHKRHHGGWGRHGCCSFMLDAAVTTGETQEKEVQQEKSQQDLNAGQNMEQEATEEVSPIQAEAGNADQVLEVADNLRKSSLE